jgi:hypothetical protein
MFDAIFGLLTAVLAELYTRCSWKRGHVEPELVTTWFQLEEPPAVHEET